MCASIVSMLILLLIIKIITVPFGILFEFTIGNLQSFEDPNLIFYPFQNIISYHLNSLRINFSAKKHCLLMRNQHVETHVKAKSQTMDTPRYKGKKKRFWYWLGIKLIQYWNFAKTNCRNCAKLIAFTIVVFTKIYFYSQIKFR